MADAKTPQQGTILDKASNPKNEMLSQTKARKKVNSYESSNLGKTIRLLVSDFSDPNRPPFFLETKFPNTTINAILCL